MCLLPLPSLRSPCTDTPIAGFSTLFPFLLGFQRRLPRQAPQSPAQRLTLVVFAFAPVFVLLSIRDETLFFAAYVGALLCWARVEGCLQEERERERRLGAHKEAKEDASENEEKEKEKEGRALGLEDVRIAVTFIFFLHVGFFGTGEPAHNFPSILPLTDPLHAHDQAT